MAARKKARKSSAPPPLEGASRMGPSDAVFWYAEELSPGLRSTIGGVLLLEGPPDFDQYRKETEKLKVALRVAGSLRRCGRPRDRRPACLGSRLRRVQTGIEQGQVADDGGIAQESAVHAAAL